MATPARGAGLAPTGTFGNHKEASLLRLDVGTGYQYWYGLPNFYAITATTTAPTTPWRYGSLAFAVRDARGGY